MVISGKKLAEKIKEQIIKDVANFKKEGKVLRIGIITVGNDSSWESFVRLKKSFAEKAGIDFKHINLSKPTNKNLIDIVERFNKDKSINGFIVQRPVPKNINQTKLTESIDAGKDIDGFKQGSKFDSPVWLAVKSLLREIYKKEKSKFKFEEWLKTKNITVVGEGETAGKPTIQGFKKIGLEVKIVNSRTKERKDILEKSDIIVCGVGKERVVTAEELKKGAILIGIGTHRGKDNRLEGDYDEQEIEKIVSFYTPTPGGVGPLNMAFLFKNLIQASK